MIFDMEEVIFLFFAWFNRKLKVKGKVVYSFFLTKREYKLYNFKIEETECLQYNNLTFKFDLQLLVKKNTAFLNQE